MHYLNEFVFKKNVMIAYTIMGQYLKQNNVLLTNYFCILLMMLL